MFFTGGRWRTLNRSRWWETYDDAVPVVVGHYWRQRTPPPPGARGKVDLWGAVPWNGWGGPGTTIRCETSEEPYRRGTVGMALSGRDTGGSQWFITHSPQPHLDGRYAVFGQVTDGWDVLDGLVEGDRVVDVTIVRARESAEEAGSSEPPTSPEPSP